MCPLVRSLMSTQSAFFADSIVNKFERFCPNPIYKTDLLMYRSSCWLKNYTHNLTITFFDTATVVFVKLKTKELKCNLAKS